MSDLQKRNIQAMVQQTETVEERLQTLEKQVVTLTALIQTELNLRLELQKNFALAISSVRGTGAT